MKPNFHHILFLLFISAVPGMTSAQDTDGSSVGFSGKLEAGAVFLQTNSQLSTAGDNRHTRESDGPAAPHEITSGLASVVVRYEFDGGTALYAGNPLEVGEELALVAGLNQPLGDGTLDLSLTWQPMAEAWKNPYLTNRSRSKTDVDAWGLRARWEEIGGGPWGLEYELQRTRIEADEIGALEADLKRDAWTHELGVKRRLEIKPGLSLTPGLSATCADTAGRSNRYQGVAVELLLQRARPPWVLVGLLSGAYNHYQTAHPLFARTRQESVITGFAQVMRLNLFGVQDLFASIGGGYVWSDANIDFFDSRTLITLASVGIGF